ncbi:hypothetical protein [Salinibacterium sp. SWN1162]|uniref:hypothetical protein n=1 Tax=Salinibacterium sp. SWN1162 TaxID=2792053 RepID=UPI0018CD3672|nr:hypothetical protein [Salinibacterium sp. SWN1162]MBH0009035.1 hypothetical protein [Salinibacterium sp. SWN1162]
MTTSDEQGSYAPINPGVSLREQPQRLPFDLSALSVTGLVIMCELDEPVPENTEPHMSMKMTQYLRLSDDSMIRLDMDRGVTISRRGGGEVPSWKQSAADVISEVLVFVRNDDYENPDTFPWEAYAESAQLRGISVDADDLRDLPHTVLLSDELTEIYEF